MERKTIIILSAIAVVAILGITSLVAAYGGFRTTLSDEDRSEMEAFREQIKEAITNNDFDSWKVLMESKLTEEHFNQMVENYNSRSDFREAMQQAHESGDYSQIKALKEQYHGDSEGFKGKRHFKGLGSFKGSEGFKDFTGFKGSHGNWGK